MVDWEKLPGEESVHRGNDRHGVERLVYYEEAEM